LVEKFAFATSHEWSRAAKTGEPWMANGNAQRMDSCPLSAEQVQKKPRQARFF
jgi:hypothetical protein